MTHFTQGQSEKPQDATLYQTTNDGKLKRATPGLTERPWQEVVSMRGKEVEATNQLLQRNGCS